MNKKIKTKKNFKVKLSKMLFPKKKNKKKINFKKKIQFN